MQTINEKTESVSTGNCTSDFATTITDKIEQATASITVTPYDVPYDTNSHTASATATGAGGEIGRTSCRESVKTQTAAVTYSNKTWTIADATDHHRNGAATNST